MDKDKELNPEVLDLGAARKNGNKVDEFILTAFGAWTKKILGAIFDDTFLPVTIRGTESEVSSFTNTLSKEKRYMDAYRKYGLDDPRVVRNKYSLDKAVKNFEKDTKLSWPFK
jgi:hypothetical protein